jgi:hypothetical protein
MVGNVADDAALPSHVWSGADTVALVVASARSVPAAPAANPVSAAARTASASLICFFMRYPQ